jgi:transcriptional regulator with XRE-family HTH domain
MLLLGQCNNTHRSVWYAEYSASTASRLLSELADVTWRAWHNTGVDSVFVFRYNACMIAQLPSSPEVLGQRIARLRAQRGWTQQELAERLAASRVAVSHFEMGLAMPSERTVVLLAGLFGFEPHEFVEGTNYPVAKAERLPLVTCRYTEVEHQLALMHRDLSWLERVERPDLREAVLTEWREKLLHLISTTFDSHELQLLAQAQATLLSAC